MPIPLRARSAAAARPDRMAPLSESRPHPVRPRGRAAGSAWHAGSANPATRVDGALHHAVTAPSAVARGRPDRRCLVGLSYYPRRQRGRAPARERRVYFWYSTRSARSRRRSYPDVLGPDFRSTCPRHRRRWKPHQRPRHAAGEHREPDRVTSASGRFRHPAHRGRGRRISGGSERTVNDAAGTQLAQPGVEEVRD